MEDYLLRIATINLNENIKLLHKLSENNINNLSQSQSADFTGSIESFNSFGMITGETNNKNEINTKSYFLEIAEELEHFNIECRYRALTKLFFAFLKNPDFNFMLGDSITNAFNLEAINNALQYGLLIDLIKNFNFFLIKFTNDFTKDFLSIKKLKLNFYIKINILLIFLIIFLLRKKTEIKNFIKNSGDELEETILRFFKLSPTHKWIPNRLLICLHYIYLSILISDDNEDSEATCRKIVKKDKYLNKNNCEKLLRPDIPKFFYDYEKENKYIEKFYRRNMLKRDKSEIERVVIVSILKVLLSTTDNINNPNSGDYIKEYIPEIILFHYYINSINPIFSDNSHDKAKEDLEINSKTFSELLNSIQTNEKDFYSIVELVNKVSLTAVIISFYFLIVKSLQNYDLIQYTVFAFHLIDSNGLLVFLKILNQDYKALEQQFINIYDSDVINIHFGQLIEVILLNNLKLVYKVCYKNDDFIMKYLIECKMHIMLKKILNNFNDNDKIKRYCLKLFKCQLKFYDKNWRIENVNIITSIYLNLKNKGGEVIDNYLKYDKREKANNNILSDYFMFDEMKKVHADYHLYNYTRFYTNEEEFDNYQNSKYQSLYAKIYTQLEKSIV